MNNVKSIDNIIVGDSIVGGIVGHALVNSDISGTINVANCYSNSSVFGSVYVSGIIGAAANKGESITVTSNQNTGDVTGSSYGVAGIVGIASNNGESIIVDQNLNNGHIQGETKWIGGIIGMTSNDGTDFIVVSNNINKESVTTSKGAFRVGGIIGNANSGDLIYNNVNYGTVDGYGNGQSSSYGAGGIVGSIGNENDGGILVKSKLISNENYGNVKSNFSFGGIVGNLYQGTVAGDYVLYLYNEGEVKGLYTAGLSGVNVGVKNSITFGNLTGTHNYGVIGHILDGVVIENVYYPNIYASSYGTSFDKNAFTKDDIKNVLGDVYWNYESEVPRLYKVSVTFSEQDILSINVTKDLLVTNS